MANPYFQFKQFTIYQDRCAMKVTTDGCLFGAWVASEIPSALPLKHGAPRLLDIGTGTGLLSLMAAQQNPFAIDAIEIDPFAAQQAAENVFRSPWQQHIQVFAQDLLQWKPATAYDCIISNPPFYQNDLRSPKEEKNKAHHDDGLRLNDLLHFIKTHLSDKGAFFLLLPARREKEAEALLAEQSLFLRKKVTVHQTLKHPPFRIMLEGSHEKVDAVEEKNIFIKDNNGSYTPEFSALLKAYYLQL